MVRRHGVTDLGQPREFMGTAEDTMARIDDAEILVTQLAPLCEGTMQRLPGARTMAVCVNIDLAAARQCRRPVASDALDCARASGRLGGAALGTLAVEPVPPDSPIPGRANVVVTPHMAGASIRTVRFACAGVAEEVRRYPSGEHPLNPS